MKVNEMGKGNVYNMAKREGKHIYSYVLNN